MTTSFKKDIRSHIAKRLKAQQFLENCLSEKAPDYKKIWYLILSLLSEKKSFFLILWGLMFRVYFPKSEKWSNYGLGEHSLVYQQIN